MVQRSFYAGRSSGDDGRHVLRIEGQGGVEVRDTARFLHDLEEAYSGVLAFFFAMEELSGGGDLWPVYRSRRDRSFGALSRYTTPYEDRLVLAAVKLSSPGLWEFLGSLSPLEVLRKYLGDRHERRKDRLYREHAEQRRLDLENVKTEVEIVARVISVAKEAGVSDGEVARLFTHFVAEPLERLGQHQDAQIIGGVELLKGPELK